MAAEDDKITLELDARLVEQTRSEIGADESDAAVVERALNAYLLGRLLDVIQARSDLTEQDADRLAYACPTDCIRAVAAKGVIAASPRI